MNWTFLSGDLPGDTDGQLYEVGDSWVHNGKYYIKLGSGLASTPEIPAGAMPFLGALRGFVYVTIRRSRS